MCNLLNAIALLSTHVQSPRQIRTLHHPFLILYTHTSSSQVVIHSPGQRRHPLCPLLSCTGMRTLWRPGTPVLWLRSSTHGRAPSPNEARLRKMPKTKTNMHNMRAAMAERILHIRRSVSQVASQNIAQTPREHATHAQCGNISMLQALREDTRTREGLHLATGLQQERWRRSMTLDTCC